MFLLQMFNKKNDEKNIYIAERPTMFNDDGLLRSASW